MDTLTPLDEVERRGDEHAVAIERGLEVEGWAFLRGSALIDELRQKREVVAVGWRRRAALVAGQFEGTHV